MGDIEWESVVLRPIRRIGKKRKYRGLWITDWWINNGLVKPHLKRYERFTLRIEMRHCFSVTSKIRRSLYASQPTQ